MNRDAVLTKYAGSELGIRKFYVFLFFLLGLAWGMPGSWRIAAACPLIALYVWENGILQMKRPMKRSFIIFVIGCALFFLHTSLTNLLELTGDGYIPFHRVYQALGLKELLKLVLRLSGAYVIFRCCQRHSKDGLFFRAFAWGNIVLLILFFVLFKDLIGVGMDERFYLTLNDDGGVMHPNGIAYHFLLFFYVNLLAAYYSEGWVIRVPHWAFCCMAVLIIILTQSRTILLALLLGLALVFFFAWNRALFGALLLGLLCVLVFINDVNLTVFLPERFTVTQAVRDRGAGRTDVWRDYLEYATPRDWLIGRGFFAYSEAVLYQKPLRCKDGAMMARLRKNGLGGLLYTHNLYLGTALLLGIGGLVVYCGLALMVFFRLLAGILSKRSVWIFLPMWCGFLIGGCTELDLGDTNFLLFWAIALSQACVQKGENIGETRDDVF